MMHGLLTRASFPRKQKEMKQKRKPKKADDGIIGYITIDERHSPKIVGVKVLDVNRTSEVADAIMEEYGNVEPDRFDLQYKDYRRHKR
jgi:hypothetical protein